MLPGRSLGGVQASSTQLHSSTTTSCTAADLLETDLWTYALPAGVLNENGKQIRVTVWGVNGANANLKSVRLYFGATVVASRLAAADNDTRWRVTAELARTGAATQLSHGQYFVGGTGSGVFTGAGFNVTSTTPAETLANSITLKVTGQSGTGTASDVCFKGVNVELIQTSTTTITTSTGGVVANPILLPDGSLGAPSLASGTNTTTGLWWPAVNTLGIQAQGVAQIRILANNFEMRDSMALSWSSTADPQSTADVALFRDNAANVLGLRSGTSPMAFRVYNTFTDAANYERGSIAWGANVFDITTAQAGTGSSRALRLYTTGTGGLVLGTNNTTRWQVDGATGHFVAVTDNTYDIGQSGASRPRNVFVAGDVTAATVHLGGSLFGANNSTLANQVDGNWLMRDSAGTSFNLLQFGGTTSAFPALKRNGATLQVRLADDSGPAILSGSTLYSLNAAPTNGAGTGLTVNDAGMLRTSVYQVQVASTAFTSAALTSDVTIATLPAKTQLLAVYADLTQVFACTATCTSSTLSLTLGSSAGGTDFLLSFDADAATTQRGLADADLGASLTRATAIQGGKLFSWTATTPVSLRLTSGTGNIGTGAATNLSQGSITFYLVTTRLQ